MRAFNGNFRAQQHLHQKSHNETDGTGKGKRLNDYLDQQIVLHLRVRVFVCLCACGSMSVFLGYINRKKRQDLLFEAIELSIAYLVTMMIG